MFSEIPLAAAPSDSSDEPTITGITPSANNMWQDASVGHQWGSGAPLTAGEQAAVGEEQPENMEQQENMEGADQKVWS